VTPVSTESLAANGFVFTADLAGPRDGALVLLLHGFPQTRHAWRAELRALAAAGYRACAPDQRGYSAGARPAGVDAYRTDHLVADALALADALGAERFHLVGHDWGAAVGWATTLAASDRVISWTALSIPHPAAFVSALANDPDQQRRSRYFMLFRTPWLPELLFSFNRFALLKQMYASMPDAERDEYLRVFAEPGALTAALNWYRAMDVGAATRAPLGGNFDVVRPVLFIWGNRDVAVSRAAVEGQRPFMKGPFQEFELDASHWLMEEAADQVTPKVLAHLAAAETSA
jgi:pimeloyl-ACP methyl ester carboxylesterase